MVWARHTMQFDRGFICQNGWNGPLARYAKLRLAHAPGMPGKFSPLPRVSDPNMHHGTCVTHVPWWMPGSLTSGFLWSRLREKRSPRDLTYCSHKPECIGTTNPDRSVLITIITWHYQFHSENVSNLHVKGAYGLEARAVSRAPPIVMSRGAP